MGLAGTLAFFCCGDRKSTRLNSSHLGTSYAVFCLKNIAADFRPASGARRRFGREWKVGAASPARAQPGSARKLCIPCRVRSGSTSFFNDTAPTEIYTLSLHDALPIWLAIQIFLVCPPRYRFHASCH